MTPEVLGRLSSLLDEALELDEAAREAWLARLPGDAAELGPTLRKLLARQASKETGELLDRPPRFTLPAGVDAPTTAFQPGDTLGPYRLLRALGHGGMGEVWQAERADGTLKRKVALKLPHVTWAPGLPERFAREREILASLEHPNIARLYDAGFDPQGRPYMALEYVEGLPIDEFCKRRALPVERRLRLLLQVADAVAFAHSRLVIHRDLKPGNILVTDDGQVRLLDFGIAKLMEGEATQETALTRVGGRALTLDYASPEQIRGEPIGTSSDVYSLAVVAFELLAGARPYKLKRLSAAELEEAIAHADAPLASEVAEDLPRKKQLKGDLDAILNKALKKDTAQRYPTVDALAQDWRRHLEGHAVSARPDTLLYRLNRLLQRHRVPVAAAVITMAAFGLALGAGATALVILVLLLGLGAALWQARRARVQAHHAEQEATTARAVQRFLADLFRANAREQPDPQRARARTAKELLDDGAARIEDALGDAPAARFALLKTLADMYADVGEPSRAVDLASQRVALAERVYGPGTVPHAEALTRWGEALVGAEQHEVAKTVLYRAAGVLDALKDPDPSLRIDVDLALGELYRYLRDARGLPHAQRAVTLLMRGEPSLRWLDAQRLLGAMQGFAGNLAEACATLDRAIALAPTVAGGHARLPMLYEEAAAMAEDRGDPDTADRLLRAAIDAESRLSGPNNSGTIALMRQRARLLTNRGRVREALALFADALTRVDAWPDSADRRLLTQLLLMLEGRAWHAWGHPERALVTLDRSRALMVDAGENPRSVAIIEIGRCAALTDLGRLDEADAALAAAGDVMRKFDLRGPDQLFNLVQATIRLALARRDPATALACWTAYTEQSPPDLTQAWMLLLRAEIAWSMRELALAEAQAAAALERMRQPPEPFAAPKLAMRAHQILGLAQLGQDRTANAIASLEVARQLAEPVQDAEHGLERAAIDVDLALALLARGERQRATALYDAARAVHARHPQVAAVYAERLHELAAAVAGHAGIEHSASFGPAPVECARTHEPEPAAGAPGSSIRT